MLGGVYKTIVLVLLVIFVIAVIYSTVPQKEGFTTKDITEIEQKIIAVYNEVLQRTPTSGELLKSARQIASGEITVSHLRQRLIDSDEYLRASRMQNNELIPQLPKALTDKRTLSHISQMYRSVYSVKTPPRMALPLKDLYVMMDYKDTAFIRMLQNSQYPIFEEEVLLIKDLKRDRLITIYKQYFGDSDLTNMEVEGDEARLSSTRAGNAVPLLDEVLVSEETARRLADEENAVDGGTLRWGTLAPGSNAKGGAGAKGGAAGGKCLSDSEMRSMLQTIMKESRDSPSKCPGGGAGGAGDGIKHSTATVPQERIHLHTGDMVLRPEFSWSVPGYQPPVCTTLGEPALEVAPLLENSTLLLGTPLPVAAKKTQVGSIMPKFSFDRYV